MRHALAADIHARAATMRHFGIRLRRRPMPRQLQPNAIRLAYYQALKLYLGRAKALVGAQLVPQLAALVSEAARERGDGGREDARPPGQRVSTIIEGIGAEFLRRNPTTELERLGEAMARRTSAFQREQLGRQLRAATGLELPLADPQQAARIQQFTAENVALIKSIPQQYFAQVEARVIAGVRSGDRAAEIAADLQDRYDVSESRARLIANDQIGKFYGEMNQARQEELGIDGYTWQTANDNRVRPDHQERQGLHFAWDDPPEDGHPGEAINCLPGSALVSIHAPAFKAYRRWYCGELTELVSHAGEPMRCTPNHPVLTRRGWIAAHLVQVGDDLVETPAHSFQFSVGNPERSEATAEQVFSAFKAVGVEQRIAGTTSGFHGDGSDQQVDVVEVNWGLLLDRITQRSEMSAEDMFALATQTTPGFRRTTPLLVRFLRSAHGIVSGVGKGGALAGSSVSHAEIHGITSAAWRDAIGQENATDRPSGDVESLSEGLLGSAVRIEPQNFRFRKIEKIVRTRWEGLVYNFETATGWFGSHGRIIHNCRCWASPDITPILESL